MAIGFCNMEIVVPKPILFACCLLGFLQNLISHLFAYLGLSNFIDFDEVGLDPSVCETKCKAASTAVLIKEKLPVFRFEELAVDDNNKCTGGGCSVCLEEFEGAEEIRRLVFCKHVFHRICLDRWIDIDQKTCPLCRTPLVGKKTEKGIRRWWL